MIQISLENNLKVDINVFITLVLSKHPPLYWTEYNDKIYVSLYPIGIICEKCEFTKSVNFTDVTYKSKDKIIDSTLFSNHIKTLLRKDKLEKLLK